MSRLHSVGLIIDRVRSSVINISYVNPESIIGELATNSKLWQTHALMKRILVAKLRHHGDVLLSSPVFTCLRRRYPDARIDAYVYKETLPMLEGLDIDNYYLFDRKKRNTLSILKKIWQTKYDLAINLTEGDRGAIAALFSRAKVRVGYDPDKKTLKNAAYTHMVRPVQRPRHTVRKKSRCLATNWHLSHCRRARSPLCHSR